MVTDGQVRKLRQLLQKGRSLAAAARMTGMDEKTARSYREHDKLPSQATRRRDYRTRIDSFAEIWHEVQERLQAEPKLQAHTLFAWIQDRYPGQFPESTRRTFERRVRLWRSTQGPPKNVSFPQIHHPGQFAASDFTVLNALNVTIARSRFNHTLFHCVLTYSNVESVSLCFSESFEALSDGVQKAFWEFGGVPKQHRTDSLSAAINNHTTAKDLTSRYHALMRHYGVDSQKTNARCPNENGDVESLNGHIKNVIDQALLLRGSRDFDSRQQYLEFVEQVVARRNANRRDRFTLEQEHLAALPEGKLASAEMRLDVSVRSSSTITIRNNHYSVPSRLIGEKVDVTIDAEWIEVTHHGIVVQRMSRLLGVGGIAINYRHVIDSLVRKPGAFENYQYREEMFPTSHFRIAYDMLCDAHAPKVAVRKYLELLKLAAHESQEAVQDALRQKIQSGEPMDVQSVRDLVHQASEIRPATDVRIDLPDLSDFDSLLQHPDMESSCNDESTNHHLSDQEASLEGISSEQDDGQDDAPILSTTVGIETENGVDRAVSGATSADVSGPLRQPRRPGGEGEPQSSGISSRTGDAGMPVAPGKSDPAADDPFAATAGKDLGDVQLRPSAVGGIASTGESSRRILSGPTREFVGIWQARFGEESSVVCLGRAVDFAGPQHAVDDVQLTGPAAVDCQTRLASGSNDQAVVELRGAADRRLGLCAAEPRGDGGIVHTFGGTVRAWECAAIEQPALQQMGPDLQGSDDDGGRDRPTGASQRHHRVERAELPRGDSQTWPDLSASAFTFSSYSGNGVNLLNSSSNCR